MLLIYNLGELHYVHMIKIIHNDIGSTSIHYFINSLLRALHTFNFNPNTLCRYTDRRTDRQTDKRTNIIHRLCMGCKIMCYIVLPHIICIPGSPYGRISSRCSARPGPRSRTIRYQNTPGHLTQFAWRTI